MSAGVLTLLAPKWRTASRRLTRGASAARTAGFALAGLAFWVTLFGVIRRLLVYFRNTPGIGDLLAAKLLGLILLAFLSILLLSNVITALSTFFLARDMELLAAAPLDRLRLYGARLAETLVNSSWMVALMLVPVLAAFAAVYDAGPLFLPSALATVASFLVIPAVIGTAITQLLVNVFPARRARELLALLGLLGFAAAVVLFRMMRPEQLARPEGYRDLVDFVATLRAPQSPWLPSEWAAEALLAPLGIGPSAGDGFPLLLLASTAAAFVVMGAWVHGRLFESGLTRAHEGAETRPAGSVRRSRVDGLFTGMAAPRRALLAKDIRTFFRDTTQWSQLMLLGVLVIVYVYNIMALPLHTGEDVGFFLTNVVAFLNQGLAGFVLAAVASRFLFPAISLEGRTLWLLRSSPLPVRSLLWSKFWVGVTPLLVLSLALTITTNFILRVQGFVMVLSLVTIVGITFAMAAMALGIGALFPKFDSENPADIPASFGGLLFMMSAIAYLGIVIALQAWPVYAVLRAQARGRVVDTGDWTALVVGLGLAVAITVAAIVVPLRAAANRLETLET